MEKRLVRTKQLMGLLMMLSLALCFAFLSPYASALDYDRNAVLGDGTAYPG